MDKAVISALISGITKEELEKKASLIRLLISKEVTNYFKSKTAKNCISNVVKRELETMIEENMSDYIDSDSIERIIRKTVSKIVCG